MIAEVPKEFADVVDSLTTLATFLEGEEAHLIIPALAHRHTQGQPTTLSIQNAARAILANSPTSVSAKDLGGLLYYLADILEDVGSYKMS